MPKMRGKAANMHLFSRGIPRLMSSPEEEGPRRFGSPKNTSSSTPKKRPPPHGARKILFDLWITTESDNKNRVDESCEEP
jgi:hypothetical protein